MPPKKKELCGPPRYTYVRFTRTNGPTFRRTENRTNSTQKAQKQPYSNIPELHSLMLVTKASHGTVCMYSIRRERRRGAGGAGEKQGAVDKLRKAVRQQEEEEAVDKLRELFDGRRRRLVDRRAGCSTAGGW